MFRLIFVAFSLGACSLAAAQALTLSDIKAKNAVQLSAEDLKQLMPGANVVHRTPAGTTRRWENKTDGTLVASSDASAAGGGRAYRVTGSGAWRVADNGRFCVAITWNRTTEDSCRYIFKADGKYFGVGQLEDTQPVGEFEFSK
jgi:maltoporin